MREGAIGQRILPDGRELVLYPMLFGNSRLCIGEEGAPTFDNGYCYQRTDLAFAALNDWDGSGDPHGYYRNLATDHRQPEFERDGPRAE